MSRILLDQGLPRSTVAQLVHAGWDAVHVYELGLNRAPDVEILRVARDQKRVVVTLDADFHALLSLGSEKGPSVIRIRREGLRGDAVAALLLRIWSDLADALEAGAMVTVTEKNVRVHRLQADGANSG